MMLVAFVKLALLQDSVLAIDISLRALVKSLNLIGDSFSLALFTSSLYILSSEDRVFTGGIHKDLAISNCIIFVVDVLMLEGTEGHLSSVDWAE